MTELEPLPSYLDTPPSFRITDPVNTNLQELPLAALSWRDFERLCLRLARQESQVDFCRQYGVQGDDQAGIDLFARGPGKKKYTVYQCKRVQNFGPSAIAMAITEFVKGKWAEQSDTFVLCTSEGMDLAQRTDEIEKQRKVLDGKNIRLEIWDRHELTLKLKQLPEIVNDFFGKAWVESFCGVDAARHLTSRLDVSQISSLREQLLHLYRSIFHAFDTGLPGMPSLDRLSSPVPHLHLEDRFITPEIVDYRMSEQLLTPSENDGDSGATHRENESLAWQSDGLEDEYSFSYSLSMRGKQKYAATSSSLDVIGSTQRHQIDNWLDISSRHIILGGPGSGKSSALQFIAMDLLKESPKLLVLARKWGTYLPIWVPFSLWTQLLERNPTISLKQAIYRWLESHDKLDIYPLIEQALNDHRLLLLVDGLDEWANESAAQLALNMLTAFLLRENASAILTCRPYGFDRLSIAAADWHVGILSNFALEQQKKLARAWFLHWYNRENASSTSPDLSEQKCMAAADALVSELERSDALRELARTPLILSLLIALKLKNAQELPRTRFMAYEQLVQLLISDHPQRRRAAALRTTPNNYLLSQENIKLVLSFIAYFVLENYPHGAIGDEEIKPRVVSFLQHPEQGWGLSLREANEYAEQLLDIGQREIGVLVRTSQRSMGFLHRALHEHLAAYYLSHLSFQQQLDVTKTKCHDPQWRETIFGLCHFTSRPNEVEEIVKTLQGQMQKLTRVDAYAVNVMLAELAFGEYRCPPRLAQEIAEHIYEEIECGAWMRHRQQLLHYVLGGLQNIRMKEAVQDKLRRWAISRDSLRGSLIRALAKWKYDATIASYLVKNLYDEEVDNQRAAAQTLAEMAKGAPELRTQLYGLARDAIRPSVRAAALEAISQEWEDNELTAAIAHSASCSAEPELRLVGISTLVRLGQQSIGDLNMLIHLGRNKRLVSYQRRQNMAEVFVDGWPNSEEVRQECLHAVRSENTTNRLDKDLAVEVLLRGYADDAEVVEFCVQQILRERFPFFSLNTLEGFDLLGTYFRDNPRVVDAVDEWLDRQSNYLDIPQITLAARAGRTAKGKAKLLSLLDAPKGAIQWPANVLLDEWGMEDGEVAIHLTNVAFGPSSHASIIAHFLPRIIKDTHRCRERLLELVDDPETPYLGLGRCIGGFSETDPDKTDLRIVDSALARINGTEHLFVSELTDSLIREYPSEPRVRALALAEAKKREPYFARLAYSYPNDAEFRQIIIDVLYPLPTHLRNYIADKLSEGPSDDFARELLNKFDFEKHAQVKTSLSTAHHTKLLSHPEQIDQAVQNLIEILSGGGFDHIERKQAALSGLLCLNQLDILLEREDEPVAAKFAIEEALHGSSHYNPILIRQVLENWSTVEQVFGENFWKEGFHFYNFWERVCPMLNNYPQVADRFSAILFGAATDTEAKLEKTKPNILRFVSRHHPQSRELLALCLQSLGGVRISDGGLESAIVAAEILGAQFSNADDVLEQLLLQEGEDAFESIYVEEGVILALCQGWRDSSALESIFERIKENNPRLTIFTYFALLCTKGRSEAIYESLLKEIEEARLIGKWGRYLGKYVTPRLRSDDKLAERFWVQLQQSTSPSEKLSLAYLVSHNSRISHLIREWCISEIDRQLEGKMSPEVGYNLMNGRLEPVATALLELIVS